MVQGLTRDRAWNPSRARLSRLAALIVAALLVVPVAGVSQDKSGGKPASKTGSKSSGSAKSSGSKTTGSKSSGKAKSKKSTKSSKSTKKPTPAKKPATSKKNATSKKADKCGKATYHKVVSGDTLWDLANRYRTTVSAIERMNGKKAKNLKPGVRLMVKPAKPCPKPKEVPKPVEPTMPPEPSAPDEPASNVEPAKADESANAVETAGGVEPRKSDVTAGGVEPRKADVQAGADVPARGGVPAGGDEPEKGGATGNQDGPAAPVSTANGDEAPVDRSPSIPDDDYDSLGVPAVNLPAEVAGTPVDGVHPDEELALFDESAEMGGDDLPIIVVTPEQGAAPHDGDESEGDLYPSDDDDGIADDDIEPDEKDPYSGDGIPEDLVELPDFPEFGFRDDGAECAYYLDALDQMPKNPKGTVNIYHKVRKGDNLWKIAKKYKTTVRNLENLNRIRGNKKKAQRLMHPGKLVMVRLGDPKDLLQARPFLADWVQLKTQKGYNIKRPAASYGRPWAMKLMLRAICEFKRRNPEAGNIVVGDWSGRVGGQLGRHLSHRTGRDVDLNYFIKDKPGLKGFVRATPSSIDVRLSWEFVRALLDTRQVEFIFMDWTLQREMYDYAISQGFPEAELNQIFQYPEGKRVRSGIIRWARGHDNHIHVRFRCPKDDPNCR